MKVSIDNVDNVTAGKENFFWEGWDLFFFVRDSGASVKPNGVFRNGKWGTKTKIKTENGEWLIPNKFLRT